jgi:hypothetical protein
MSPVYPFECLVKPTARPMIRASSARTAQARTIRKVRRLRPKYDRDRGRTALNFSCSTVFPPARLLVCDVVAATALESHSARIGCCVGGWSGVGWACASVDIAGVFLLSSFRSSNRSKLCYKQETREGTHRFLCND